MPRTTSGAVQGILVNDYDGVTDLQPYIDTAGIVVDAVVVCAAKKGIAHPAATLEMMERWLAAHFYGNSDKPYSSRSTLSASGAFHGRTDMALDATLYGQTAKILDTSGCLATIGSTDGPKIARALWLGKRPSEQIDVDRRS